jgi:hypothetical protein
MRYSLHLQREEYQAPCILPAFEQEQTGHDELSVVLEDNETGPNEILSSPSPKRGKLTIVKYPPRFIVQ